MMKKLSLNILLIVILGISNIYSQDYFPLIQGSFWIYNVYQDGDLSYIDSTVYQGNVEINDTTFYKYLHYYIEDGTVASVDTFFLYDNFTDENTIMLSNRNMDVVDSAVYAKHSYTDGEWWIAHKIPQDDTIRVETIGELTVTAGTYSDCFMQGDEYIFAPNIGIIKIKLWNETSYYDLLRYHIPSSTAINKVINRDLEIYPNPAKEYVQIKGLQNASYRIVTAHGQIIDRGIVEHEIIKTGHLQSGIYFLHIEKDKKEFVIKMIRE